MSLGDEVLFEESQDVLADACQLLLNLSLVVLDLFDILHVSLIVLFLLDG